jgi:hypothetical protein
MVGIFSRFSMLLESADAISTPLIHWVGGHMTGSEKRLDVVYSSIHQPAKPTAKVLPSTPADTDDRAQAVQYECWRRMDPGQRLATMLNLSGRLIALAKSGLKRQQPDAGDSELFHQYIANQYGEELAAAVRRQVGSGKLL